MGNLDTFLKGGSSEPATPEPGTEGKAPEVKDEKPAELSAEKPTAAAPAPSAGQAEAEPDAVKAEKPDAKPDADARARDEKGRFKSSDVDDEVTRLRRENDGLKVALRETRDKNRQPAKRTSFLEDPDKAADEREAEMRGEIARTKFSMSEAAAKTRHADFDEITTPFLQECHADETLAMQVFDLLNASDDPGERFYQMARGRGQLKQYGDLDKYRESVEAPLKAQLADEVAKREAAEAKLKNLSSIPRSLNAEQGASSSPGAPGAPAGKLSLTAIVEPRKKRRA